MKNIIVSAVNFRGWGARCILKNCLEYLSGSLSDENNIIALVPEKDFVDIPNVTYYEFPNSRKSWLNRIYYEYVYFKKLSKKLKPYLWLSLHDMTPNVESEILAVYCHNPSPFYKFKLSLNEMLMEPGFAVFVFFYKYVYQINIRKSDYVIVQQDWLRKNFIKLYHLDNVIVSYPVIDNNPSAENNIKQHNQDENFKFFYPAFPRVPKNFQVICEAAKILLDSGVNNFEVYLTIDGRENSYSRYIYNKYRAIDEIKFIGLLSVEEVYHYYNEVDCLLFPSKLETWGLPITEFKHFAKPILLADLEYAHETIGTYDKARFFDPDDPLQLSHFMIEVMKKKLVFDSAPGKHIADPFVSSWKGLFDILLSKKGPGECTL